ncbi:hypothetical protein N185_28365 [Sinorhizobium sp. GW3]|jgi:hypothetical protein|nr:hypothetical protein N185_28365 [Sinorhizobium sp. GW3]
MASDFTSVKGGNARPGHRVVKGAVMARVIFLASRGR